MIDLVVFMSLVLYNVYLIIKYVVENIFILCICYCYEDVNKLILVEWILDMRRNLLILKDILLL